MTLVYKKVTDPIHNRMSSPINAWIMQSTVSQIQKEFLIVLYETYPVKDLSNERSKIIQNARANYPNGFEICDDGMVNIFLI